MKTFSRNPYDDNTDGLKRRLGHLPPGSKLGILVGAFVVVIFIGWLGYQAMGAKSSLEQARNYAQQAKEALLGGKTEDGTRLAENADFHAREARSATHSLPWNVAAAIPWLGSPFKAGQQITDVVVGLTADVLRPATHAVAGISPDTLFANNQVNLQVLREKEPELAALSADATRIDAEASAITQPTYISALRDARSQLQDETSSIAGLFKNSTLAARLAPSMLGADGPRTYLMGFQTNAEARGTGGLLGGFGILRFDSGKPTVGTLAQNTKLGEASADIDLGPEFNEQFGFTNPYTDFRNSNLSSHFPYAAQIWSSMWEEQSGIKVDGVIAIDPVALSYLLGALGPITMPDGEIVSRENVVELTMSTVYARFPPEIRYSRAGDPYEFSDVRKEYLQGIAKEVAKKLTRPIQSPRAIIDALGRAASERRIAVWSSSPADQKILEETPLAYAIPDDPAPYAEVVINNLAGNKMDYYLNGSIEYVADGCDGDTRNSTVTVRLANTAKLPLPKYVTSPVGLAENLPLNSPPGTMVTSVRLIATSGAKLAGVTSGDKPVMAVIRQERGHPSFEVQVAIPPGQSGELTFRLIEPTVPGVPRVPVQPLANAITPQISVPTCR